MDNLFIKKRSVKIVMIILVFLTLFNFMYPRVCVYAAESTSKGNTSENGFEAVGGVLLEPLVKLILALGEAIMSVVQNGLLGVPSTIHIQYKGNNLKWAASIAAGAGIAIACVMCPFAIPGAVAIALTAGGSYLAGSLTSKALPDDWYFPMYLCTPQEIFSDSIPALSVNFINPKTYANESDSALNTAKILRPQISRWYVAIRNMVLVGLMVVLLYIGIRIVISSAAGEKAKYKEHLIDWLIAVILVVFMHYIMAFALTVTDYLTQIMKGQNSTISYTIDEETLNQILGNEEAKNELFGKGSSNADIKKQLEAGKGKYTVYTNLMGYARIKQQLIRDEKGNEVFNWDYIGYAIIYMVLVIYTLIFLVIYLKRVVYMAFLTTIAPLVALTYPLDKINDGKAQAFDMWLKEYIYNLLLQPFHLLLYTMLVGSVMEMATKNMLYALVALGFLIPAEKILRRFFGFEKAPGTGSLMGNIVGGSLVMDGMKRLAGLGPPPPPPIGKKGGINGGNANEVDRGKIRTADNGYSKGDQLYAEAFGGSSGGALDANTNNSEAGKGSTAIGVGSIADKENAKTNELEESRTNERLTETNPHSNYQLNDSDIYGIPEGEMVSGYGEQLDEEENPTSLPEPDGSTGNAIRMQNLPDEEPSPDKLDPHSAYVMRNPDKIPKKKPEQTKWEKFRRSVPGALLATGGHYALKATPKVVGTAAKISFAATGAMVGTAAGIASGNLGDAVSYGIAGAVSGKNIGQNVSKGIEGAGQTLDYAKKQGMPNLRQKYYENKFGNDKDALRAKQNELADKRWMKDKNVQKMYKDEFGDEWKDAMNNALEFRKHDVTDDKSIISAMKLDTLKGQKQTSTERIALAKAASTVKSQSDLKMLGERLGDQGISDKKINETKKNIRKMNNI